LAFHLSLLKEGRQQLELSGPHTDFPSNEYPETLIITMVCSPSGALFHARIFGEKRKSFWAKAAANYRE
jgi:hypothetical protein